MSESNQGDTVHQGGCLCGAVRYKTTGTPNDTNICYCTQCQRQSGSPLPAFANFNLDQFEIVQGELGSYRASDYRVPPVLPELRFVPVLGAGRGDADLDHAWELRRSVGFPDAGLRDLDRTPDQVAEQYPRRQFVSGG